MRLVFKLLSVLFASLLFLVVVAVVFGYFYWGSLAQLAVLIPALVVIGVASTWLVSGVILEPLRELVSELADVAGNPAKKFEIKSKDEIGLVAHTFNELNRRLGESTTVLEAKVKEETSELAKTVRESEDKNRALGESKKAVFDLLKEVDEEKDRVSQERDKVNTILYSIGDGVFVIDLDYKIILINPVATNMAGFTTEECLNRRYDEVLKFVDDKEAPADQFIKDAVTTGERRAGTSNQTVLLKKNGDKLAVAEVAAPFKDSDGKSIGCVVVFRDVTREREIDRMKTDFISLASHQLRTPLSAMKWFSEMLISGDAGKLTEEQLEFVDNIYQSNERMIGLVNALLDISRIESGRIIIDPKPTDLVELVREVVTEIQNKLDEKKQKLVISAHGDLPHISIDPKLVREVYKNLLTNANKYTPNEGEIFVIISKNDQDVISQVSDNGYGIPKLEQKKVFQRFWRAENVIKKETEGTGLGLYLAKAIIDSSGGKIWFESEENKGTTFWFSLPLTGSKPKKGEVSLSS